MEPKDFGQDGWMPTRRDPAAGMPASADRAFKAMSSRARIDVLRALMQSPDQTRQAIADSAGLSVQTVYAALESLEELGYVEASAPPGQRHGRLMTYSAAEDRFRADQAALLEYIAG